ncbi:hypothetical protein V1478_010503 [Vespula squamosa]|uniref:Uncharacterized protein n=1 Tax=Vespula squamosa TaxID=30214 RepID=A0ABD2AHY2_VESSQ
MAFNFIWSYFFQIVDCHIVTIMMHVRYNIIEHIRFTASVCRKKFQNVKVLRNQLPQLFPTMSSLQAVNDLYLPEELPLLC